MLQDFDVAENLALALHRRPEWRRGPLLRWPELRAAAAELIRRYQVRAPGTHTRARALSGGNQQRVVVGRELESGRDLLVAENPTRGLDVAATAFVHSEMRRLRAEGATGIALLSTDLDEVLALADRVLVMVRGRLAAVPDGERTRIGVGRRMLSAAEPEASGG
jgi:simple sugar transport system ATP-binding protein